MLLFKPSIVQREIEIDTQKTFLQDHFSHRQGPTKACLVLGRGFDPRMLAGFHLLRGIIKSNEITVIMLTFDEGTTSPSRRYDEFVKKNLEKLNGTIGSNGLQERRINMFSTERRRITSRSAEGVFRTAEELKGFTDIFVDVSSLPRSVYFPVIAKLLFLLDSMDGSSKPNLFVLVSESAVLDAHITKTGWLGLQLFCRRDAPALGAQKPSLNALLFLTTSRKNNNLGSLLFAQAYLQCLESEGSDTVLTQPPGTSAT